MKVKELITKLETLLPHYPQGGDCEVRIVLRMPSLGPLRTSEVKSIQFGIDWDANSCLIYPQDDLVIKEEENKCSED